MAFWNARKTPQEEAEQAPVAKAAGEEFDALWMASQGRAEGKRADAVKARASRTPAEKKHGGSMWKKGK
jgi:hypothetical protein